MKHQALWGGAAAAVALSAATAAIAQDRAAAPRASETYGGAYVSADGAISLPESFVTTWEHLGSWSVVNDAEQPGDIHNVYVNPGVVEAYRETGAFPDGATLVKEVRAADHTTLTTGNAYWATDVKVWFVMVKDAEGRFSNNDLWGDGWGWALFNGDDPTTQVATNYETDCRSCHVPAKATDWVYVYAYPKLGQGDKAPTR